MTIQICSSFVCLITAILSSEHFYGYMFSFSAYIGLLLDLEHYKNLECIQLCQVVVRLSEKLFLFDNVVKVKSLYISVCLSFPCYLLMITYMFS